MAYTKYSLTPADNNAAPPNGAPEGMLPSAVNDTMRDMMAQIRDVGDGIRGGTYTMTAPVITGGSITGVALTGNTFTSPIISGGSINNTPIGATTASTGAFSTLSVTGATTFSGATVANTFSSSGATITGGSISGITDLAVADGGTGRSTLTANAVLVGDGTSSINSVAPGTSGNVLTSDGTSWTSVAGAYALTSGTAVASTSGTSIDFTSIPSWVKRVTVLFNVVSTNGSSNLQLQIGSSSVSTSGYTAQLWQSNVTNTSNTSGFVLSNGNDATYTHTGSLILTLISSNLWICSGVVGRYNGGDSIIVNGVSPTLGGALDRVRITTVNGTDTFDAGSINILYE
jgi:hypothetical protein